MTRPMTGQPENADELNAANTRANVNEHRAREKAGITRADIMDVVESINQVEGVLLAWAATTEAVADVSREEADEVAARIGAEGYEVLGELDREAYEDTDTAHLRVRVADADDEEDEDELTMVVREHASGGENEKIQTFTREEWDAARTPRGVWGLLEAKGELSGCDDAAYVRVESWFSDTIVNKITSGGYRTKAFMAVLVEETDAAYKFRTDPKVTESMAFDEEFHMPKSAAQVFQLR